MQELINFIQEHLDNNETFYYEDKENSFLTFEEFVNKSNIILTENNIEYAWDEYEEEKYFKFENSYKKNINYSTYLSYQKYIYNYIFENIKEFYNDLKTNNYEGIHTLNYYNNEYTLKILIDKNFDYLNDSKFNKLLKKYNVFISNIRNGDHRNYIYVEENDMAEISDIIYNDNNGILYHITTKENADKILKYGLEPRSESKKTWHPERIYFVNSMSKNNNDIHIMKNMLLNYWDNNKVSILKIDLNKLKDKKIKFFKDPTTLDIDAYFTQEPIPPYCIKEVYLSMFDKVKEKLFGFSRKLCKKFDKIIFK